MGGLIAGAAAAADEIQRLNPYEAELQEIRAKYRVEVLQRKLLYNQVQELKGNIRVFCRVREVFHSTFAIACLPQWFSLFAPGAFSRLMASPLLQDARGSRSAVKAPSQVEVSVQDGRTNTVFDFDRTFGTQATQAQVFEDTEPLITSVLDGFNVCILAYGQTGAGKTFTMNGPPDNPGVNRRAVAELLRLRAERSEDVLTTIRVRVDYRQATLHCPPETDRCRSFWSHIPSPGPLQDIYDGGVQ